MEDAPGKVAFLTAATKHFVPVTLYCPVLSLQGTEVSGYTIIGIVPAQDSVEVGSESSYKILPSS